MRSTVSSRVMFSLTLFATLAMICSSTFARGRGGGGGGRAGGGRSGPSAGGRSGPSRAGNAAGNPKNLAGQAGNLSSKAGDLKSGLSDKSQLQGILQQQSGQLSNSLSNRDGQLQSKAQNSASQFQNRAEPFTPAWYADHPNAWQQTHPHADAAVVASTAAVAAWIGTGYYAPANSGGSSTTVVYAEEPQEEVVTDPANVSVLANVASDTAPNNAASNNEEWFPVGIYSLATTKNAPALQMLQLVVDHQGNLRGVYYDSITDTSHNIVGVLDQQSQAAEWRLEANEHVSFQSPLNELTQSVGTVKVILPAGPQQWQLTRVEYSK